MMSSKQSVMKPSMGVAANPGSRNKNSESLSIYERSVLQLQKREQKLNKIKENLMSEYTFAPDMSLSKVKSAASQRGDSPSSQVTPGRKPKNSFCASIPTLASPKRHASLPTTPDTTMCNLYETPNQHIKASGSPTSPPVRRLFRGNAEKVQCEKNATGNGFSSGVPNKSKLAMEQFPRAAVIPVEVFVTRTSSAPPHTNGKDKSMNATVEDAISCVPDDLTQGDDTDCGSV